MLVLQLVFNKYLFSDVCHLINPIIVCRMMIFFWFVSQLKVFTILNEKKVSLSSNHQVSSSVEASEWKSVTFERQI